MIIDKDGKAYTIGGVRAPHEDRDRASPPPSPAGEGWQTVTKEPTGSVEIAHDGFAGDIIGHYVTREGKRGVVVQQHGTRVVHVYGEKWLAAAPPPPGSEPSSELAAQHQAHLESWKAERDKPSSALAEAMEVIRPFAEFASLSGFDKLPPELPMTNGSRLAAKQVTAADFIRARNFHASHSKGE